MMLQRTPLFTPGRGLPVLAAIFLPLILSSADCRSQTTFSWPTTPAWAATGPATGTSETVDYFPSTGTGISVSVFNSGMNWNAGDPTVQTGSGRTVTGGTSNSATNNDLFLSVSSATSNSSYAQVTLNFNYTGGAKNVSLTLWDVDSGGGSSFIDTIKNIQATAVGGGVIYPTITTSSTNSLSGTGASQVVVGTSANTDTSANGNVTLNFGATYITSLTFQYSNSFSGTLGNQWIGISPITFTSSGTAFPEVGSGTAALALCGCLLGVGRFRRRRHAGAATGA
jgi:hypothetical protein